MCLLPPVLASDRSAISLVLEFNVNMSNQNEEIELQDERKPKKLENDVKYCAFKEAGGSKQKEVGQQLADQMFVDLSQSDCLSEVRDQGKCGSCYAFAGITMAEWAYCKQMGKLRTFSEQYVLDCGHLVGIEKVCQGAWRDDIMKFFHSLGFELRDQYLAYAAKATECAHQDEKKDFKEAGFVRTKIDQFSAIPIENWHKILALGAPLLVSINVPLDFASYTSGVDSGQSCGLTIPAHSMVIVGHGRQDGKEFWLLRNSHGINWGEQGYWKLAKSAPENCIGNQIGYTYGLREEREFSINWRPNLVDWWQKLNKANKRAESLQNVAQNKIHSL